MDFRSRVFAELDCSRSITGDRSSRWQPWNVEAASCLGLFTTYVWWKTEAGSGAIVRPPGADRPAEGWKGWKGLLSLLPEHLDLLSTIFLVGASWRLPHHRTRQWRARLTFCFELLPALARPVLSISPLRLLLRRARQCSILFCSIFILFCLFAFFFVALFFGSRSLFVAPSRDVDAYPPEFRGSRGTDLSSQLRQE